MIATLTARLRVGAEAGTLRGDAVRIYGLQFAALGLGLVASVVVARVLGPTDKGVVDLFTLLTNFVADFGSLGVYSGLLFHLANRGRPLGEVHGTGLVVALAAGGVIALVGLAGLGLWSRVFAGLPRWAILLAFALAPALLYRTIWQNLLTGLNRAVETYRFACGLAVVSAGAVAVLWAAGWLSARLVIATTGALSALAALAAFGMLYRGGDGLRPRRELAASSLRFGFPLYVALLANTLNFKLDQVILNLLLDTRAVGIYAVSVRWAETLFLLDGALIAAALHRISTLPAPESHAFTGRLMRKQLLVSGGAGAALVVGALPLILGVYGAAYREAVLPLVLLVPGVVAWSLAKVLSQFIVYQLGIRWAPTLFAVAGMLVNVALNFLLIPRMGVPGAAVASLLSYGLVLLLTAMLFRRMGAPSA